MFFNGQFYLSKGIKKLLNLQQIKQQEQIFSSQKKRDKIQTKPHNYIKENYNNVRQSKRDEKKDKIQLLNSKSVNRKKNNNEILPTVLTLTERRRYQSIQKEQREVNSNLKKYQSLGKIKFQNNISRKSQDTQKLKWQQSQRILKNANQYISSKIKEDYKIRYLSKRQYDNTELKKQQSFRKSNFFPKSIQNFKFFDKRMRHSNQLDSSKLITPVKELKDIKNTDYTITPPSHIIDLLNLENRLR